MPKENKTLTKGIFDLIYDPNVDLSEVDGNDIKEFQKEIIYQNIMVKREILMR